VTLLEVTFLEFILCQIKKKYKISQNFDSPMAIKGINFQNKNKNWLFNKLIINAHLFTNMVAFANPFKTMVLFRMKPQLNS
jgi:hypothetical protein